MPASTTCPIIEVDRALSSYINSREETLRIRRTLSRYLTTSLRPVNVSTKNQHINYECPHNISAAPTNPPGLKGSRLDYLQALRAQSQAQARHRELQTSLEDLQQRHVEETPLKAHSDYDNVSTQGYIALLRQRRRLAELQVIQDSLDKLLLARPSDAPKDPKALVKETIGEQPSLPAERLDQLSQTNDDQSWVFKLKQEVLESRTNMDRAKAARAEAQDQSRDQPSLQRQVYALECARDEIVEWVQGELAKMEEDSIFLEDASPIKKPLINTSPMDMASAEKLIRDAYDQYTAARANLVARYESLQQPPVVDTDVQETPELAPTKHNPDRQMPITKILPYLPHLIRTTNNDRALLQQSVYLTSQISSADQDNQDTLLRLSGESHLLPAGSKEISAWGATALDAETTTLEFVRGKLRASKDEISGVSRVVKICTLQSSVLDTVK